MNPLLAFRLLKAERQQHPSVVLAELSRAAARPPRSIYHPTVHLFDRPLPVAPSDPAKPIAEDKA